MDCEGNVPRIGDEDGGQAVCLSIRSRNESTTGKNSYRSLLCSAALLFNRGDFKRSADGFDDRNLWLFGINGSRRFSEIDAVVDSLASKSFPLGGYHILRSSDKTGERIMTFDAGPLGYRSLAAHGHADALSITLNCNGESVLVDPGTYLYLGAGHWRDYFRSTSAHNTVVIDDQNQSEIRGPFQWGRKARARLLDYREDRNFAYLECSVHGFYQGKSGVLHNRRIAFLKPEVWIIRDVLHGKGCHSFALHFHLGSCHKIDQTEKQIRCRFSKSELSIKLLNDDDLKMEVISAQEESPLGWRSTAFGHKEPCMVVRITGQSQLPYSVTTMLHSRTREI